MPGWSPRRYLTKTLGIDWRAGADWFMANLVDADVANNYGNWQWVAGTGRTPSHTGDSARHGRPSAIDPAGLYVSRYSAAASAATGMKPLVCADIVGVTRAALLMRFSSNGLPVLPARK